MPAKTLTILEANPTTQGAFLTNGVLSHWPGSERPEVVNITLAELLEDDQYVQRTQVAWIMLDQFGASNFAVALSKLQERDIPIMLTRAHEVSGPGAMYHAGIVIGPPNAHPSALCAILRTLWSQGEAVDHLRSEITYLRAHQGGLADQMGKIDEELRLAAQLQREFLPHELPQVPNASFQVLFRPASYVSGDIYDICRLDEDHVGIFLADAVGHGVPAALMTMYIKRSLRTRELTPGTPPGYRIMPPAETLRILNQDLCNQPTEQIRFATAAYAVLNIRTMDLELSRAGHPFPLLMRADGSSTWLETEGAMLGVFEEEEFETVKIRLQPGDRLLMYSDGFELAFPQGGTADEQSSGLANEQYKDEFLALADVPTEAALQQLAIRLDNQAGSLNQRDDLSMLFVAIPAQLQSETASGAARDTSLIAHV